MVDPRPLAGDGKRNAPPGPDATAAGAFAPPRGSGRSVATFVAALVLLVCGEAGVLSSFTDIPVGYRVLLLAAAVPAAVALAQEERRAPATRTLPSTSIAAPAPANGHTSKPV